MKLCIVTFLAINVITNTVLTSLHTGKVYVDILSGQINISSNGCDIYGSFREDLFSGTKTYTNCNNAGSVTRTNCRPYRDRAGQYYLAGYRRKYVFCFGRNQAPEDECRTGTDLDRKGYLKDKFGTYKLTPACNLQDGDEEDSAPKMKAYVYCFDSSALPVDCAYMRTYVDDQGEFVMDRNGEKEYILGS